MRGWTVSVLRGWHVKANSQCEVVDDPLVCTVYRTTLWSEHRDHSVFGLCFLYPQTHQRYKSARKHHSMSETVLKGYQTVQWMTLQQSRQRVMTGLFVFHALPSRNAINRNWVSHGNETGPGYCLFLISLLKPPTLSSDTEFAENCFILRLMIGFLAVSPFLQPHHYFSPLI